MSLPTPSYKLPVPTKPHVLPSISPGRVVYFSPQTGGKGWCYWCPRRQYWIKVYRYPSARYLRLQPKPPGMNDYKKLVKKLKKQTTSGRWAAAKK